MSLTPDIQYLRVRHLGKEEGSLYLSDLDTEQNKKEPYKIPVYIPEESSVDLPLNDQVLLSFNQGTLRSFIDQGFLEGHVVSDNGEAEVWVSPDGSDENPGTRNAPFASIQFAIDTVVDRVGHFAPKRVFVEAGVYVEDIIVYTKYLELIGLAGDVAQQNFAYEFDSSDVDAVLLEHPDGSDLPAICITNATKGEVLSIFNNGDGWGYTYDGSGAFNFTGPSLTEREVSYPAVRASATGSNRWSAEVKISGISPIGGSDTPRSAFPLIVFGVSDTATESDFRGVSLEKMLLWSAGDGAHFYLKNCSNVYLRSVVSADFNQRSVLDNCENISFSTVGNLRGQREVVGPLICFASRSLGSCILPESRAPLVSDFFGIDLVGANIELSGEKLNYKITAYSGADIDFTGVYILKNVDLTGAGDVTWRGGSFYGTLTDPNTKMGGASAGDYLNVTPA